MEVEVKEKWEVQQSCFVNNPSLTVHCRVEISKNLEKLANKARVNVKNIINYLKLSTYSNTYFRSYYSTVNSTNYRDKITEIQQDVREFIEKVKCVVRELKETIEAREQLIEDIKSALPENKTYIIS